MMLYDGNTICLRLEDKDYKIFTVTSGGDGSIYIHLPYCKEKKGYVFRCKAKYPGPNKMAHLLIDEDFSVDTHTKLSIHKGGLVHFSGSSVRSGLDSDSNIKGIGIFSATLEEPVLSGPTVALVCWGIPQGFELLSKIDKKRFYISLHEKDFIFRDSAVRYKDGGKSAFLFEFFIFPQEMNNVIASKLKYNERGAWLTMSFPNYKDVGAIFTFPILTLKNLDNFVGIVPFMIQSEFPVQHEFGYLVSGPAGSLEKDKSGTPEYMIGCSYPRIFESGKSLKHF